MTSVRLAGASPQNWSQCGELGILRGSSSPFCEGWLAFPQGDGGQMAP